jgi:predicted nuclease with TOPRIM domain
MADLPTSHTTKDPSIFAGEFASKLSTLTSTIKETFPAIDKASSYANKLASAFNETSMSVAEFADKIYEMGKDMAKVVGQIKATREELIETVSTTLGSYESFLKDQSKQLARFQSDLSDFVRTLANESMRLGGALSESSSKYREYRKTLAKLEEIVRSVLSGTIPDNVDEVVRSFQEMSQAIKERTGSQEGLVTASEDSIEMVKDLKNEALELSKGAEALIEVGTRSSTAIQGIKNSLKSYLQSVAGLTKHNKALEGQYGLLEKRIEELSTRNLVAKESIIKLIEDLDELKRVADDVAELVKEYTKSTTEFVVWQHMANDSFKRFSEKMSQLPKPVQTAAMAIGKLAFNVITLARSIVAGVGPVIDAVGSLRKFIESLLEMGKSSTALITGIITLLYAFYEAGMRVIRLTTEVTKSFGEYVFGLKDVRKVALDLIGSWASMIYTVETVAKAVGDVINVFMPLGETFESLTKRGISGIVSFSMTIDRFARAIGTTASELSARLVKFASYFGYNLQEIIRRGYKGAHDILQMYSNFAGYILRKIRLTMTEVMQIFGGVFERIMWMGSRFSDINSQLMGNVVSAIAAVGKRFSLTVEHSRKLAEQFAEVIGGTTWDMYAGVLAATGRWTGTLDEMVHKALVTTPFEKARETAAFFMDIAKYSAGLKDTWMAFVPQFREIIRRFPEETDVLREAVETWVQNRNIDFREALARSGLSVDKIDEMMLVMDSLGNPLQTLVILVKRILDKLTLIIGKLSSSLLMGVARIGR